MTDKIKGSFATRREAEMAVERLVQEHGISREAILIAPAAQENTVGSAPGGVDRQKTTGDDSTPALHGRIDVTVRLNNSEAASLIQKTFAEFAAHTPTAGG